MIVSIDASSFATQSSGPSPRSTVFTTGQRGQALIEAVLVASTLALLWGAIAWFGRLQDMALQAQHASAYAAFTATREPETSVPPSQSRHDVARVVQIARGRTGPVSATAPDASLHVWRVASLDANRQVGGASANAQAMRQDWRADDEGVLVSQVSVGPAAHASATDASRFGSLRDLHVFPALHRRTAILTGGAESFGDSEVQQRVRVSDVAWAAAARASYALSSRVDTIMAPVDAAWSRPRPEPDWLEPWVGHVPRHHLSQSETTYEP